MNTDVLSLAVSLAMTESAAEQEAIGRPDLRASLFAQQQRVWDDPGSVRVVLAGRRSGKSVLAAHLLLDSVWGRPGTFALYIAMTRASARLIVWATIKHACAAHGIEATFDEVRLECRLVGGGTILLGGADDRAQIDRYRGVAYVLVVIDECGTYSSNLLASLYREVLRPATLDYEGRILFAGTPGFVMDGFWFDLSGPHTKSKIPVHRWTVLDNPHLPHAEGWLDRMLEEEGLTRESATFQREYLGVWCDDVGSLVFPLGPSNWVDSLPVLTTKGVPLDASEWRFVVGVDVGVVDATAISVVASHPLDVHDYVVRSEAHERWISKQLATRLRQLQAEFRFPLIVMDTGGMGKLHAEELSRRFGLFVEAAQKTEKESQVRIVRDRLLADRIKIVRWLPVVKDEPPIAANDALLDEWSALGWDKDRRLPSANADDHVSDATLYALRALRNYREREERLAPELGSPEWEVAEVARMRADRIARHGGQRDRRTLPWAS